MCGCAKSAGSILICKVSLVRLMSLLAQMYSAATDNDKQRVSSEID